MTTVTTDMRNTIEAARRIRFEQAVGITQTNVQKAIEQVATSPTSIEPTAVSTSPYVPLATDTVLWVDSSGGVIVINLPAGSARGGLPLEIKDKAGASNTNNIQINPNGAETIDGLAQLLIDVDYGGYRLYPDAAGGWTTAPSSP